MLIKLRYLIEGIHDPATDAVREQWFAPADICRAKMITVDGAPVLRIEARGEGARVQRIRVFDPADVATLNRRLAKLAAEPVIEALQRYGAAKVATPASAEKPEPDPVPPTKPAPVPSGGKKPKKPTNDPPAPAGG